MSDLNLDSKIEAILFWKGEPQSIKKLAEIFQQPISEIIQALEILKTKLVDRGLVLITKEDEICLGTAPQMSETIERLTKEELIKDLGKAGLETLSIILYRGPISRSEIDYIRGVQSNFILRNLQIRGLIEKVIDLKDQRKFLYKPTFDLLNFMGLTQITDLPEFLNIQTEFEQIKADTPASEPAKIETN